VYSCVVQVTFVCKRTVSIHSQTVADTVTYNESNNWLLTASVNVRLLIWANPPYRDDYRSPRHCCQHACTGQKK